MKGILEKKTSFFLKGILEKKTNLFFLKGILEKKTSLFFERDSGKKKLVFLKEIQDTKYCKKEGIEQKKVISCILFFV